MQHNSDIGTERVASYLEKTISACNSLFPVKVGRVCL